MPLYLSDKHNLTAVAAPAITDDRNDGYHEGSRWINVLTGIEYVCIDATVGSARWTVNQYAGTQSVAGLNAALGSAAETATRMSIKEEFTKRPLLTTDITPPSTPAAITNYTAHASGAVPVVSNAATDLDTTAATLENEVTALRATVASLVTYATNVALANADYEVAGTNMTSALVTLNAARGGFRLTTAGENDDQAILQPRITASADSRWATGFVTDQSPKWSRSFRLTSVAAISVKQGLALTNAHNLTTDDDQVALWFSTATGGNFLVAYSIGGTDATIDTGVTPAAGTEYRLRIELNASRLALVYLNDTLVATTPALTTAVNLIPFGSLQALTAAAKSWDCRDKDFASMEQAA